MGIYKVKARQNLYDISLELCGSIEGIFDLLISNPELSMTSELPAGTELKYHEDFILNRYVHDEIRARRLSPSNCSQHVYFKKVSSPLTFLFILNAECKNAQIDVQGEGEMIVDWGDNSNLENIKLTHDTKACFHSFDNLITEDRRIKIYGNFFLTELDVSKIKGSLYSIRPVTVDKYVCKSNTLWLDGLLLFDGLIDVVLCGSKVSSLVPLNDIYLKTLDLRGAEYADYGVLSSYLEHISTHYGTRRNCTVYIDLDESIDDTQRAAIMAPIDFILNEPEWNADPWKFIINGTEYHVKTNV